jgi:microcin C transport system permease protein
MNWLGTDDQARDVTARLIYGFRISVLFGLTLTIFSALIGVAAGAVQGYFGGWTDLLMPALHRDLVVDAGALHAADHRRRPAAGVLDPARASCCCFPGCVCRHGAGGVPARPQFRVCQRRAGAGRGNRTIMFRHLLPNAMVATLTFLPFILSGSITTLTSLDFLGFGLPPGSPRWAN